MKSPFLQYAALPFASAIKYLWHGVSGCHGHGQQGLKARSYLCL